MGNDLVVSGRAQLVGYAGLAGPLRGRGRRIATVAAVDVLAVALAFGAMHITGAMMGSGVKLPELIPPVSAATETAAATTPLVPTPTLAPKPQVLAAMPDAEIMFATPVGVARGFTLTPDAPSSTSFSVAPPQTVASAEPEPGAPPVVSPLPTPAPTPMPMPRLRPIERVAQLDVGDGSLDRLLVRDVVPETRSNVANAVTSTVGRVNSTVGGATSAVGGVAMSTASSVTSTVNTVTSVAPPVQTVAQAVTAPVSQVVSNVVGLLN